MGQVNENIRNWINKAAAPYLCDQDGEGDLYDAYLELKDRQDDGHDWHTADDYIMVWQPLANMTVKEVIELIEAGVDENQQMNEHEAYEFAMKIFTEEEGRMPNLNSTPMSLDEIMVAAIHTGIKHTLIKFDHLAD